MAENNENLSDPEQFVSAQGSENSSIAGDAAEEPADSDHQNDVPENDLEQPLEEFNAANDVLEAVIVQNLRIGAIGNASDNEDTDANDQSESFDEEEDEVDDDDEFEAEDDVEEIMEGEEEIEAVQEEIVNPISIHPAHKRSPGPGCSHYRRGCALIAPCCDKQYPCRHCHNENEQHEINRFAISEVVCLTCDKRQPITDKCVDCAAFFGSYVCLKCRVWDMDFKGQWHCDGCGICRLGGKDHFFHCDRCGYCLSVALRGDHRCIERATRTGCAICLSDLHDTRTPLVVPACGHPVHRSCWRQMIDSRRYFCPTCRRAVVDLTDIWADLDNRIGDQLNRLPPEFCLPIFCNDCQQHSSVRYNIIGYFKCPGCGSYNTQR